MLRQLSIGRFSLIFRAQDTWIVKLKRQALMEESRTLTTELRAYSLCSQKRVSEVDSPRFSNKSYDQKGNDASWRSILTKSKIALET